MGDFFPKDRSEKRISRVAVAYTDIPVEENGNAGMWRSARSALTRARRSKGLWELEFRYNKL